MYIGLLLVVMLGLLVLGGIAAVAALLASPKTRAAGRVLLAIGLIVVVVGGLFLTMIIPAVHRARQLARVERDRAQSAWAAEATERMQKQGPTPERPGTIPIEAPAETPAETPTETPAEEPPPAAAEAEAPPAPDAGAQTDPKTTAGADTPPAEKPPTAEETPPAKEASPAAAKRPQWVDMLPQVTGNVYQVAIKTDPRPTRAECESELPGAANQAISAYAETELKRSPRVARQVQLPQAYIRNQIVQQEWPEPVQTSWGKWVQLHALLQFDQEAKQQIQKECNRVQQRLEEQWQQASVLRRLCYSGTGLATVLLLLSVVFAGLKIDQATDGSYRGRLSLAAVGLVLMVAALAMFAVLSVYRQSMATHPEALTAMDVDPVDYALTQPHSPVAALPRVALAAVVLPIALLVLCGMVLLLASKRARPVGLAVLALMLIGGLAVGWSASRFHGPGPAELLVIAVLVLVPLAVLGTIAVFARKTSRNSAGAETPPGGRADVGSGQL